MGFRQKAALQAQEAVEGPYLTVFLKVQVVGVPAHLLAAVGSAGVQAGLTLAADHLVAVVLLGELAEGGAR